VPLNENGCRLKVPAALFIASILLAGAVPAQYRQLGVNYGFSQFDRENTEGQTVGRGKRYGLVFRQDINERFALGLDLGVFSKSMVTQIEGTDQQKLAERKLNTIQMSVFYRLLAGGKNDYFTPYIGAGGGFHSILIEVQGVRFPARTESKFGLHALAGLWVKVPYLPMRFFSEAQLGRIFTYTRDRDLSLYQSVYAGVVLLLLK
jgi:opacity protein-like surface antigen